MSVNGSLSLRGVRAGAAAEAEGKTDLLRGGRPLSLPYLLLAALIVLAAFTAVFGEWTATSVWSFPRFVLATALLAYFPGRVVLDLGRPNLRPLEDLTLSVFVGLISSGLLYWIAAVTKSPSAFLLWPLMTGAIYLYRRLERAPGVDGPRIPLRGSHLALAAMMLLALLPLVLLPQWYSNLVVQPHGTLRFAKIGDVVLHLSIGNQLTHSIPPQMAFFSGIPLSYHYGMHLMAAMFSYGAGLSLLDLTVRFMPTLYVVLAVLAVFCFSRVWLKSEYAAVLTTLLVIFGEDLSYIPGLIVGSRDFWSIEFFQVPATFSLYYINAMLPGLGMLFSALLCLVKYCKDQRRTWLVLTAVLTAVLVEFKIFAAGQLVAALVITGIIQMLLFRDRRLLKVLALTALLMAPLILYVLLTNEAGSRQVVKFQLSSFVLRSLDVMRLRIPSESLLAGLLMYVYGAPIYLVGTLGARIIAIPRMVREVLSPNSAAIQRFFMATFIIIGIVMTLTCTIMDESGLGYNNAVWFYSMSKLTAWIFVVEVLWGWMESRGPVLRALIVAAVVAVSVPSTVQHLGKQLTYSPKPIDKNTMDVIGFLKQVCSRGEVVFVREGMGSFIVAMTTCRVPLAQDCALPVPQDEFWRRRRDQRDFWNGETTEEARHEILQRYKAHYLVIDKRMDKSLVPRSHVLNEPLFENAQYALYLIRRQAQ
jgi:hypothetical protein